jgi:hypothetical protein
MSTSTEPVAPVQSTSPSSPEATLQTVIDKTAENAAKLAEADATLAACVDAFKIGETSAKTGRMEAGRLAEKYLALRMSVGHSREAAAKAIAGELAKYASDDADCDVSRLIRCYHAWRLLVIRDESGAEQRGNLPYGHYVIALSQLVERTTRDSAESWSLLPGMEADCLALFKEALTNGYTRLDLREKVRALHVTYALKQSELRDKQAREAASKAETDRASAEQARKEAQAAQEAEKQAKEAFAKAKEEEKQRLTNELAKAKAELLSKQQAAAALNASANQAERDRKHAESAAKLAAKQADKLANKSKGKEADKPKEAESNGKAPVYNPVAAAKHSTAKDLAALIRDMMCANKPADVLREFAAVFDWREHDAMAFAAGLASNPGKHASAFAFKLAETLLDKLEAPPVGDAVAKSAAA